MTKPRRIVLFDETGLSAERIKALRISIWAIAFGAVSFNITGGIAMTGYLKELGVSDFVFGLLIAVSPAASTLQILVSYFLERTRKRKAIFLVGGLIQRLVWLPFGLVPFIVPIEAPVLRIWMVSLLLITASASNQCLTMSYNSLLADIIPGRIRGSYLSTKSRISTVAGILGGFLTAWLLERFPGFNGYALVFGLATLIGCVDILMFINVEFPPMPVAAKKDSLLYMLRGVVKNKKLLGLVGFFAIWNFSLNLSVPFYLVYIRVNLGMSNGVITMIAQILPNICSVVILSRWGRMLDRRGMKQVLGRSGKLFSLSLLLWVFVTPGVFSYVLIVLVYMARGLLFAGTDISSQNAILSRSPERNRSMFIAIYHCVTTLFGIALANVTAGWLLDNPLAALEKMNVSIFGVLLSRYNYLFLLTFILCMITIFLLLPKMIDTTDDPPHVWPPQAK